MIINRKNLLKAVAILLVLVASAQLLRMQLGLANYGQEFGTYGQYNRVVRLAKELEDYKVVNHGLNRDLDWKNLNHLNRFYVILKDDQNTEFKIEFHEETEEIKETNEETLKEIINRMISEQVNRHDPSSCDASV